LTPNKLLLLSCSKQKNPSNNLIPAIERYNGPRFRLLRHYLNNEQTNTEKLKVMVFSAEYGLIDSNLPIPDYDRVMSLKRANELAKCAERTLHELSKEHNYKEIWIDMSRNYLSALESIIPVLNQKSLLRISTGLPGQRLAELRHWLYGYHSSILPASKGLIKSAYQKHIDLVISPEQLRGALNQWQANPQLVGSYWAAIIEGEPVGAKWLVSQLTGKPVSSFHTDYARRYLRRNQILIEYIDNSIS
jgi:hypothetical protein